MTIYPNLLKHAKQEEAEIDIKQYVLGKQMNNIQEEFVPSLLSEDNIFLGLQIFPGYILSSLNLLYYNYLFSDMKCWSKSNAAAISNSSSALCSPPYAPFLTSQSRHADICVTLQRTVAKH